MKAVAKVKVYNRRQRISILISLLMLTLTLIRMGKKMQLISNNMEMKIKMKI